MTKIHQCQISNIL